MEGFASLEGNVLPIFSSIDGSMLTSKTSRSTTTNALVGQGIVRSVSHFVVCPQPSNLVVTFSIRWLYSELWRLVDW